MSLRLRVNVDDVTADEVDGADSSAAICASSVCTSAYSDLMSAALEAVVVAETAGACAPGMMAFCGTRLEVGALAVRERPSGTATDCCAVVCVVVAGTIVVAGAGFCSACMRSSAAEGEVVCALANEQSARVEMKAVAARAAVFRFTSLV